jgi:Protein of unknown function (DUF998)
MTTTTANSPPLIRRDRQPDALGAAVTRALLACGILYGALYVVANDLVAAASIDGYSRLDQAVSELSANGATSQPFLRAMLPVFTLLMLGFAAGVWRAAQGSRALRITGGLLVASGVVGVTWLWFPMTARGDMVGGAPMPANDLGHLVLSGLTVALILLEMGFAAAAFGKWFRVFSAAAAVTLLSAGALMGSLAAVVSKGEPTHWMGLYERIMLGAWLLWMAALAGRLMRSRTPSGRGAGR